FIEKPKPEDAPSNLINAGAYCLEPVVLDYIETGRLVSMEQEVFPRVIEDTNAFYGYRITGYWIDVGRIESYLRVHRLLLQRMRKNNVIGENSVVRGKVESSSVGNSVSIAKGSKVESSVIFDAVEINKNVFISNSVIGESCRIGENARIVNSVIGDGEIIEGNTVVENTRVWVKPVPQGYPRGQVGNVIRR
ncbi:MAG TPA: NDP-sugar synthase, partial [Thermoplasmatales archaeon]|nr:NDP-sugar synthase [Thermoplasmatales archaeon]